MSVKDKICQECGSKIRSAQKRLRRWCSRKCYLRTLRRRHVPPMSEQMQLAAAAQEQGNGSWLHASIESWYRDQANQRRAVGISQPIPLATVLACHDQQQAAFVNPRLVHLAAAIEDVPGPASEAEDD